MRKASAALRHDPFTMRRMAPPPVPGRIGQSVVPEGALSSLWSGGRARCRHAQGLIARASPPAAAANGAAIRAEGEFVPAIA